MSYIQPTASAFKAYFDRDFCYATEQATSTSPGDLEHVRDRDIERAFVDAVTNFNEGLFPTQEIYENAFLHLAAHYLCHNMRQAQQGLTSKYSWLAAQRSVGDVFEGYFTPDAIKNSPWGLFITSTMYGAKYYSLVRPLMTGNVMSVEGTTRI